MSLRCAAALAVALVTLAGCARSAQTASSSPSPATSSGTVGYVRMDALVKRHPLYTQLAKYDADIAALSLRSLAGSPVAKPGAALAQEDARLRGELKKAADHTNALLKQKQTEYAAREKAAIDAALRAGASAQQAPSGSAIASQMNATAGAQRTAAAQQAQRDLEAYRKTLIAQDNAAIAEASRNLTARASRTYHARAEELQAKESALALDLANKDAADRLALRTRLSNLALDDAAREDVRTKLAALDRKESDEVAAMRNRDQQSLETLQNDLNAQVRKEMAAQAQQIHNQSVAKLRARENAARVAFAERNRPIQVAAGGPGNGRLPPDLQAKVTALHKTYQEQFDRDAKATIADFNRTRTSLQKRFDALYATDANAQSAASKQMADLQRERSDLYNQMLAQIDREVRTIAHNHGIAVVFSGVVAPAGGVDLTADAQKEIESLHE